MNIHQGNPSNRNRFHIAIKILSIILLATTLAELILHVPWALASKAHVQDRFYTTLHTEHFADTNLLNVVPVSNGSSGAGYLPFDLVNASSLWYDIEVSTQDVPIVYRGGLQSFAYLSVHLLPPNTTTPFDCLCFASTSEVLHASVTFQHGGQTVRFTLDPFTVKAATLDAIAIILGLIGDVDQVPFPNLFTQKGTQLILHIAEIKGFSSATQSLIDAFKALPNTEKALNYAQQFLRGLDGILQNVDSYKALAKNLDELISERLPDGTTISVFAPVAGALHDLLTTLGKLKAIYDIAKFIFDEAATMGSVLTTGYTPTVTLESVSITPSALSSPTAVSTSVPMPPTQTNCPASGTARAAIIASLATGNDANIVYSFNEGPYNAPTSGMLKRYDVRTGSKTMIVQLSNASIYDAQLSADGQWLLFLAERIDGQVMLQMVRMDGRGLQTLYCFPAGAFNPTTLWSSNQKLVALSFSQSDVPSPSYIYLLNILTGSLQMELTTQPQALGITLSEWVGNSRVIMSFFGIGTETSTVGTLYALDVGKGSNQQESDLQRITYPLQGNQSITDYTSSYDGLQLITSSAGAIGAGMGGGLSGDYQGFGTIIEQPLNGAPRLTLYNSITYAVTGVQIVDQKSLLFIICNQNYLGSTDTSHNGLWKINADGTGLVRLTSDSPEQIESFGRVASTLWSNVSRDGNMYVLLRTTGASQGGQDQVQTLLFGSLAGGSTTTFATTMVSNGSVSIVGWTIM